MVWGLSGVKYRHAEKITQLGPINESARERALIGTLRFHTSRIVTLRYKINVAPKPTEQIPATVKKKYR